MYPDVKIWAALFVGQLLHGHIVAALLWGVDLVLGEVGNVNGLFQGQQVGGGDEGHRRSLIFRISNLLVAFLKVKCYNGSNYA